MNDGDGKILVDTGPEAESLVSGREVRNCRIRRQDLTALNLAGTRFNDTDFQEVGLAGAVMQGCSLSGCRLAGVALRGTDLSETRLDRVEFRSCDAVEAVLRDGTLVDVTFVETPLGNAVFRGGELVGGVFDASDLYAADFRDSVVVRTRFENRRLGNAVLSRADFGGAVILEADFRSADLAGANFRDALVIKAGFKDANLTGTDFTGAVLVSCDFSGVNADGGVRAALMRGAVRPEEAGTRVLEGLKGRGHGLVPVVHALLTGYVLGESPVPVTLDQVQGPAGAEEGEGEPSEPDESGTQGPPARNTESMETSPESVADDDERKTKVARESQEVYERFKKIEMD